jgi:hypothetical protein
MSHDPGLAGDTCIFMESVPGDQGTHTANAVWWLSPDIILTGPASGPDVADAGQSNPVQVKFHRKSAASGCHFPGDESVTVELWVANPSLVIMPRAGSATRVGFIGSPVPVEGGLGNQEIDWTPPASVQPDDPQSPGPKCLVARCYPDSGIPSHVNFFLPGDQHVAQRNLCVISTTAQVATFQVNAMGLAPLTIPLQPAPTRLRAVLDLAPDHFVTNAVLTRLELITGFQRLRTTSLRGGFKFVLAGVHVDQVIDHSQPGPFSSRQTPPSFEARVELGDKRPTPITFEANLEGVPPGDACIFHLTQTTIGNVADGGLTLVVLKL